MSKIVFDIGGTNMRVAKVEKDALRDVLKLDTPRSAEEGIPALFDAIRQVAGDEVVESVSGGIAGMISDQGRVLRSPNLPGWDGFDLKRVLQEKVSGEVLIHNDAELAGLAEAVNGAGKDKVIVAYVGVGTGIGGAKIVGGQIEANKFGFEPGHHIVDVHKKESFESMVSGHALAEKYGKLPKELDKKIYDELVNILATGIYNIILLWSPEVVVLGGSLISEEKGFNIEDITSGIRRLPSTFPEMPEIRQSALGDEAGLHGAMIVSLR